MKLKNLFYLLLALPLAFASCDTLTGDEPEPAKEPKLSVTSSLSVEFDHEGGAGIIKYTLENAPEGAQVTATCEADWVSDITVGTMITYMVDSNKGEARETKVVVSYEEQVFEVNVAQSAKPASTAPVFTLVSEDVIEVSYEQTAKSIEYTLENPIAGVVVEAKADKDWITITNVADGAIDFIIGENEGSARTATITATYGLLDPIVVTVNQAAYVNPDDVITTFGVVDCWASSENGGKQWDVTFVEHDDTLGDMQTRISFSLAEANVQRVSDGTYSVADGTILLNTAVENGYSTYRYNSSEIDDILDATFTVATDTNAKTISINGTFKVGDKNIEIKYNGDMRGMDLGEAVSGAIEYNEWSSVYKQYHENGQLMFYAISSDNALKILFNILHSGGTTLVPEATYYVAEWEKGKTDYLLENKSFYNNVEAYFVSGYVTVEHVSGGYKLSFDLTDEVGRHFIGTYEGAIRDANNPA